MAWRTGLRRVSQLESAGLQPLRIMLVSTGAGAWAKRRTLRPLPSPFCPPSMGSPEDESRPWLNCFVNSRLSCACHDVPHQTVKSFLLQVRS